MIPVLFFLSLFMGTLAAALLVPALIAITLKEHYAVEIFLLASGLIGFLSGAIFFALRGRERGLRRGESYLLTLLIWTILPIAAAGPIGPIGGIDPVSAVFEATSGLTTTGATVFRELDTLPRSLIFWRAELQWIGGLLTLLTLVLILAPTGAGGIPHQYIRIDAHRPGQDGRRVIEVIRAITVGYTALSLACLALLVGAGMPIFDAACFAMSTISTGGFMPRDGTLSVYANPTAEFVLVVFMLIGGTSILWHRQLMRARFRVALENIESMFVVAAAIGLGLVYAVLFLEAAGGPAVLAPSAALREGLFTGVSLLTTSGFEVRTGGYTILPLPLVLFIVFVGGATFSTAGGIKAYRIGAMFAQSGRELVRLIHPHSVSRSHFGRQEYSLDLMKAVWAQFSVAVCLVALGAALVALNHIHFIDALTIAVGAFANIAAVYTTGWPGATAVPEFAGFADPAKLVLAVVMVLGRLEILILFGAIRASYWRR
ncbi:MAG: TrkH family potassium uptake protein [Hyphomicrobiales bacterium]|nr:TrkH family potassium uptake protein [Hyphomicrobiales bacterium]